MYFLSPLGFFEFVLLNWQRVQRHKAGESCVVDGRSLDLAAVVAVGRYGSSVALTTKKELREELQASIDVLDKHLKDQHPIYGVTTGFGGSATTRTTDTKDLQRALIQHQNSGILTSLDVGQKITTSVNGFDAQFDTQAMPTPWVRASMLIRCNSLARRHSAVRVEIIDKILSLLSNEITPIVPLRGSISASGDLSPLSYLAGTLEGSPDIHVRVGRGVNNIKTAKEALSCASIEPVVLRAKEGLGLLNGTAVSAATAALALYQAHEIAVLSQILTAMTVEALQGSVQSFDPKISGARPHPGQMESAAFIRSLFKDSSLVRDMDDNTNTRRTELYPGLYQDRYSVRTSPQWIGPQLEDLAYAHTQLSVELNSTTDNPIIDTARQRILNGGNFQAAVVTSVMDRTRLALDKFGRMLFAQTSEIINPFFNNGLPANLADDDPSLSYTCKGIDINIASYASELSYLANPVGNHVLSAEMHNQSINSLALISSRYTLQAIEVSQMLCAACLYTLCQAIDLRVHQVNFLDGVRDGLIGLVERLLPQLSAFDVVEAMPGLPSLWPKFMEMWPTTASLDICDRAEKTVESLLPFLADLLTPTIVDTVQIRVVLNFSDQATRLVIEQYRHWQSQLATHRLTMVPANLGVGTGKLYTFVRQPEPMGLGIPFHRGLVEHPTQPQPAILSNEEEDDEANTRRTIGTQISIIYEAIRDGRLGDVIMKIVHESLRQQRTEGWDLRDYDSP